MPRYKRPYHSNGLLHILTRGVNRCNIFQNELDYQHFLNTLRQNLLSTKTLCYAWELMPNHIHLLLKTSTTPIGKLMHSLLTSHSNYFNYRHNRVGHLFQNRFKSILCNEADYFLTLVSYIHQNPLKANLVNSLDELAQYPWCGHGAMLGHKKLDWQKTDDVLSAFDQNHSLARKKYINFIQENITKEKKEAILHGKIIQLSNGIWQYNTQSTEKEKTFSFNAIAGDHQFIRQVFKNLERKDTTELNTHFGLDLNKLVELVANRLNIPAQAIINNCREKQTVKARALLCAWGMSNYQLSAHELASLLNIQRKSVYRLAQKGRRLIISNAEYACQNLL